MLLSLVESMGWWVIETWSVLAYAVEVLKTKVGRGRSPAGWLDQGRDYQELASGDEEVRSVGSH